MSRPRFELRTFCVLDRCDNQLRHRPVGRLAHRDPLIIGGLITIKEKGRMYQVGNMYCLLYLHQNLSQSGECVLKGKKIWSHCSCTYLIISTGGLCSGLTTSIITIVGGRSTDLERFAAVARPSTDMTVRT